MKELTPNQRIAFAMMKMAKTLGIKNYDASHWEHYKAKEPIPKPKNLGSLFETYEKGLCLQNKKS